LYQSCPVLQSALIRTVVNVEEVVSKEACERKFDSVS